ncbi:MAG: ectoine hydroxylase-related dioxygenase (phytanoyl-CoA dioxygenase family) [Saprospiraceae bacterium]|jgi:ectoine hydroxylase-related dioxygenase (phytanoyl-CoA dioxygenase family)
MMLKSEEIQRYQEHGYVVPDFRLPDDFLVEMREAYARLIANNSHISADFMLAPHLETGSSQGLIGNKEWLEFATYRPLLDMAADLIGEDIILWGTTLFGKPANGGKETPWHQDGDYYPIRPLETMTIWIPLDDVSLDNGPMRFIPGSHKARQTFSHSWVEGEELTINLVTDDEYFDESTAENLIIDAGQVSYHDVYMIHGSYANNTNRRRAAMVVRLMPASSLYDHALGTEMGKKHAAHGYGDRALFLVRGKDIHGGNNFEIGHP